MGFLFFKNGGNNDIIYSSYKPTYKDAIIDFTLKFGNKYDRIAIICVECDNDRLGLYIEDGIPLVYQCGKYRNISDFRSDVYPFKDLS